MAAEGEKRKLVDLRVVDLRAELEKRGLDNKGVKATLIERLQKVLQDEGQDSEESVFEIEAPKALKRASSKRGDHDGESETQSNADENHDTSLEVDECKVKEEEEEEDREEEKVEDIKETVKTISGKSGNDLSIGNDDTTCNGPAFKIEVKCETSQATAETTNEASVKQEACEADKTIPEANGVDNEDSINLTIGEDEEKLLADEVGHKDDTSIQEKEIKDEGVRAGENPEEGTTGGDGMKQAAGQEEDKDTSVEDSKQDKAQEEIRDDKGEKGKSILPCADQKMPKDEKEKRVKPVAVAGSSRNLWVSGLSSSTRATDLKQVFSKYGKVIGAKVVTNARTPGARCYGYVTMATSEDASKCIQHLHRTELHGRMISVERAKGDAAGPPRKGADGKVLPGKKIEDKKRHERKLSTCSKTDEKKIDKEEKTESGKVETESKEGEEKLSSEDNKEKMTGDGIMKDTEQNDAEKDSDNRHSSGKVCSREVSHDRRGRERRRSAGSSHYSHHSHHSLAHSRSPHRRYRHTSRSRQPCVLTYTQIRKEHVMQSLRKNEREQREEDRRRREEMARQREIERRQREERIRLEREKEQLRIEREHIEMKRAELMQLEREQQRIVREQQRLEREKLEREREELKRQQISIASSRLEEARRSTKRTSDDRRDSYGEDRKRVATDRRYESSQSSRFDDNSRSSEFQSKKEYKHSGEFSSRRTGSDKFEGSNYDQDSRTARGESMVMKKDSSHDLPCRDHTIQDVGRRKDGRFDRGQSFHVRDERRPESDHRPKVDIRHSARDRYADSGKGESRYSDRVSDTWHASGGPPPVKPFGSLSSSGVPARDSWSTSGDRKCDGSQSWHPMDSSSSDRWVSGGSGPMGVVGRSGPGIGGPGSMYTGQQNVPPNPPMNMGISSSGPYGTDRFDAYKQSMVPIRKY